MTIQKASLIDKAKDIIRKGQIGFFAFDDMVASAIVRGYAVYVDFDRREWTCTCPANRMRKVRCKHIIALIFYTWLEGYISRDVRESVLEVEK